MKTFYSDQIFVHRGNWSTTIFLTPNSGKIIYRDKVDTLIGIKHPGIILGQDGNGTVWVIHNHYGIGFPEIVTLAEFCSGAKYFFDLRKVFYSTIEIIERAVESWKAKKEYSWLLHNCQHFVNKVTQNSHHSETIDKVSDGAMFIGGAISLVGLFTGNKSAINIGLSIAGAGAAGKVLSR